MPGPYANQKHFFRDDDDNRTVVITTWLPSGEFGAYRDDEDDGQIRGFGITRLEAIADLKEWIEDHELAE